MPLVTHFERIIRLEFRNVSKFTIPERMNEIKIFRSIKNLALCKNRLVISIRCEEFLKSVKHCR